MFEVFIKVHVPFVGKIIKVSGFSSPFNKVPEIPLSNHGFQGFIDRLFRIAGLRNWIPLQIKAVDRTTIPGPAE